MKTKPFAYQVEGVRLIDQFNGRCLLADSMGLGKSIQALMYANNHPELRPMVIVCPASLKWNWESECIKHFGWRSQVLEGTRPPARSEWTPHSILIVNYDILGQRRGINSGSGWLDYLTSIGPKLVILDESHAIADRAAKRTKWAKQLCQNVPHVIALSGTPIVNRPAEMWTTLNLLRPDLYPSFFPFGHRYCDARKNFFGWEFKGATNIPELHEQLTRTMMVRRRKEDVLKELPSKVRSIVPFKLNKGQLKEYDEALNHFASWLDRTVPEKKENALKAEALTQLGYLKRLASSMKLEQVINWVDNFLDSEDGKIVVFAIHKAVVSQLLEKYRKTCVILDGTTPMAQRRAVVDKFQNNNSCRVFIGNIKAAGVGLTLTAASTVAFAELDWVPGNHTQAEDRCHRIGTKSTVNVYYMVAQDTIEETLVKIIQQKQQVVRRTLDGENYGDDLSIYDQLIQHIKSRVKTKTGRKVR